MDDRLSRQVDRYIRSRHKQRYRTQIIRCLALLVAFATVYALIMPAITLSNEVVCGMEAHTHTESCYRMELTSPQPELTCGAGEDGAILIHTHDAFCYDERGNLICTLPEREAHTHTAECYQETRTLICEEPQELGHTHTAACYAYDKGELICGQEEGQGGHVHSDACYPTERVEEPVCGLEEDEEHHHIHDESCYTVVVRQKLKCGLEEREPVLDEEGNVVQEGHTHTAACWMTDEELRVCGQEEGRGHIHTDACYQISEVLACQKQELVPHAHGEGCYDESGTLICALPEVGEHQHSQDCVTIPEGEPEEVRTLICGLEEHTHVDACYVELIHNEDDKYFCQKEEHLHTGDCYFESGALRCTLEEHMHTAACLEEQPEEPPEETDDPPQEPEPDPVPGVVLEDYPFVYEGEAFTVTYRISGVARLAEENQPGDPSQEPGPADPSAPPETGEPEPTDEPAPTGEPEPDPTPEPEPEPTPEPPQPTQDELDLDEGDTVIIPLASKPKLRGMAGHIDSEPDADTPPEDGGAGSATDPGGDAVLDSVPMPTPDMGAGSQDTELDPALVEIRVTELLEGTPEYEAFLAENRPEDGGDEESVIRFNPLELHAAYQGQELDLSQCTMTVEYRPTELLIEQLESAGSGIMTIVDGGTPAEGDGEPENVILMRVTGDGGEELGCAELTSFDSCLVVNRLRADARTQPSLENQVNPPFTVQYYAYLDNALSEGGTGTALNVINTEGGKLPVNGTGTDSPTANSLKQLYLDTDGNVERSSKTVQQLFQSHRFKYVSAPGLKYFNIVTGGQIQGAIDGSHYDLDEIWVLKDGKSEDSVNREDWAIYNDSTAKVAGMEKVDDYQVTNRAATANTDSSFILIEENTVIRLVYKAKEAGNQGYNGRFFDYDVSGGPSTATSVNTKDQGINNYGTKKLPHLAFGNGAVSNYANEKWLNNGESNYLNQKNRTGGWGTPDLSYEGCTFSMVTGYNPTTGKLTYASGLEGPDMFVPENVTGKHVYDANNGIVFNRVGDTYTLSSVSSGAGSASSLDKFGHPGNYDGTNGNKCIWTNHFWPVDQAPADNRADPLFGGSQQVKYNSGSGEKDFSASDDGLPHNSYFGMTFSIDFTVTENYTGPLEYYFFGDDDMWVFLTEVDENGNAIPGKPQQLVCDIGGIHSSVGEYVNLWDWVGITKATGFKDLTHLGSSSAIEDAIQADSTKRHYRLDFCYTERGASGSTCWMQFTLPQVAGSGLSQILEKSNSLSITKAVTDLTTGEKFDSSKKFKFRLELTDKDGNPINSTDFGAYRSNRSGQVEQYEVSELVQSGAHEFELGHDESLVIVGLPAGAKYRVIELAESQAGFDTTVDVYRKGLTAKAWTAVKDATIYKETDDDPENGKYAGTVTQGEIVDNTAAKVDYTNRTTYELPETGGAGMTYTVACVPLLAAGILWYKKKPRGEGAEDRA